MDFNFDHISPERKLIMTPDSPFFYEILHGSLPPGWKSQADSEFSRMFVVDSSTGILRPTTYDQLEEYVEGGEYDDFDEDDGCLEMIL